MGAKQLHCRIDGAGVGESGAETTRCELVDLDLLKIIVVDEVGAEGIPLFSFKRASHQSLSIACDCTACRCLEHRDKFVRVRIGSASPLIAKSDTEAISCGICALHNPELAVQANQGILRERVVLEVE